MEPTIAGTPAGADTQTEVVSATRAAAEEGNLSAFLEADRAARTGGKPVEKVERVKPAADAAAKPGASGRQDPKPAGVDKAATAKGPTPADREADERLQTRIREAVETSTQELSRQNRELKERLDAATVGTRAADRVTGDAKPADDKGTAAGPGRLTKTEIARYQAMPGAPKLDDKDNGEFLYDTAQEHSIALADFIRETRQSERAVSARTADDHLARSQREANRVKDFGGKIEKWKADNADRLVEREIKRADGSSVTVKAIPLSAEMSQIHGFAMLNAVNEARAKQGLAALPATVDHAIGELIYDADDPGEVGSYLSEHPEELTKLRAAQSPEQLAKMFGRLEDRAGSARASRKNTAGADATATQSKTTTADTRREAERVVDRSVSSVKVPETTLGKGGNVADPLEKAVADGDIGLFLELDRQARIDKMTGHRRA